ncbi:hypothetical protein D3C78_1494060 [compost metagenome]
MVKVGVGKHHCVQAGGIERELRPVAFHIVAHPLAHAAFQQNPDALAGFQQITGAGDFLDCADESEQGHDASLFRQVFSLAYWGGNGLDTYHRPSVRGA